MDLTKELPFKVGDEIKNYKEMCKLLGEKQRAGNSKKSQLNRWQNYFNWEYKGYKFIITEVLCKQFPTHDNNQIGAYVKQYNEFIQKLILHMLQQYGEVQRGSHLLISNKGIVLFLGLFGATFFKLQNDPKYREEFAKENKIPESFIREFFHRMNSTMYNDINTALKQLQNKGLIYVTEVQIAKPVKPLQDGMLARDYVYLEEFLNSYGQSDLASEFLENYGIISQKEYNKNMRENSSEHGLEARVTTPFEKSVILLLREIVLKKLKLNSISHAWARNLYQDYQRMFQAQLKDYLGIAYIYRGYEIVFSKPVLNSVNVIEEFGLTVTQEEKLKEILKDAFSNGITENLLAFEKRSKKSYESSIGFETAVNYETGEIYTGEVCFPDALTQGEKIILSVDSLNEVIETLLKEVM